MSPQRDPSLRAPARHAARAPRSGASRAAPRRCGARCRIAVLERSGGVFGSGDRASRPCRSLCSPAHGGGAPGGGIGALGGLAGHLHEADARGVSRTPASSSMPPASCAFPMRAPGSCFLPPGPATLHADLPLAGHRRRAWPRRAGTAALGRVPRAGRDDERLFRDAASAAAPGRGRGLHARHLRRRLRPPCHRPHARRFRRQCQPRAADAARLADRLHRDAARAGPQRSGRPRRNSCRSCSTRRGGCGG